MIEGVIPAPVLQMFKAASNCVRFHRGNPKTGKGFLAARLMIDKAENQFSLAPRVAGVHDFRNVGAVHEVFQDFELFSLVGGYAVLPFLRQNG